MNDFERSTPSYQDGMATRGSLMLISSHNPAGILRSPASYICHALQLTCTKAAQSLWVRLFAARNALTASALGKATRGLRFGWLGTAKYYQEFFWQRLIILAKTPLSSAVCAVIVTLHGELAKRLLASASALASSRWWR